EIGEFYVESGEFEIMIGKSSRDIVLKETVYVESTKKIKKRYHINSTIGDIMEDPEAWSKLQKFLADLEKAFGIESYISYTKKPEKYLKNDCLRRILFYYVRQGADMNKMEELMTKFIEDLNS
ncbi:MAG: glycosyl hydrolase, partial [Dictyoglomus sp.]